MSADTSSQPSIAPDTARDWTYRTAQTKPLTHGIPPYPAMMIPQIAQRLVRSYGGEGAALFDPYCGSGTTLLEGIVAGMRAAGTDLNPLVRLIARVKTTPVCTAALDDEITRFSRLPLIPQPDRPMPDVDNSDYWFSAQAQRALAAIRQHIDSIANPAVADVFRVAFSQTVRKVSWTRKSEFKLYRMSPRQMDKHDPQPRPFMVQKLSEIRRALQVLGRLTHGKHAPPFVYDFNTVEGIPAQVIAPASVDLVITSPPYGDSRTTVAYGQFCRLSSQWLGYASASRLDSMLMGGGRIAQLPTFGFPKLDRVIAKIAAIDERRACEVASFFADYRASIRHVAAVVKPQGHACYVVGNRTVKGQKVPTAEATAWFFGENNFKTVEIGHRQIPNKRMPAVNSPSNVRGEVGQTMTTEQIVICQKA